MSRTYLLLVTAAAMIGLPAFGQMSTRRASITGGGGDTGKCTVEVRVDGAAEVEITGDMGRIRTLYGQPASWNRFDCSSPLPRNPVDFRFRGVDGRGNVQLIRDPSSRGGTAVVRVEDPKGGAEGYTFDLEWRGSSGYDSRSTNRGGYNGGYNGGSNGGYNDGYGSRRQDDRYNRGRNNLTVSCSADGNRRRYCDADTSSGVRLIREYGNSACRLGSTWGFDRRGIWVDRGCQGEFQLGR